METKLGDYHEVFVPFTDIYTFGGLETFRKLKRDTSKYPGEKNLIVISSDTLKELEKIKANKKVYNPGADDSLRAIMETGKSKIQITDDKIDLRKYDDGLDIAILWEGKYQDRNGYSDLEKKIKESFNVDSTLPPTFITKEYLVHTELDSLNLTVQEPHFLQVDEDIVHRGIINGNDKLYQALKKNSGTLNIDLAMELLDEDELYINQFIKMKIHGEGDRYARITADLIKSKFGKITNHENMRLELLNEEQHSKKFRIGEYTTDKILGITPRDMEQYISMQFGLLNPDVGLFFLCGSQGSGKTLLGYVSAVEQILWHTNPEERIKRGLDSEKEGAPFKQLVVLKPDNLLGDREVGFLPGDLYSKLEDTLGSYIDAHKESSLGGLFGFEQMFMHPKFKNKTGEIRKYNKNIGTAKLSPNNEAIELTYSGFLRGRSFTDTLIIIDETQNFTPYEVKTIIERSGEGCKIVAMGDPLQLDNLNCSRKINGLTHAINHYLPLRYSALVNLSRNYRSQMSEDATSWRAYRTA